MKIQYIFLTFFLMGFFYSKSQQPHESRVKQISFNELYSRGVESIRKNDTEAYDEIIRAFRLSPFAPKGLSIAEQMLIKNHYAKSYYDIVSLYPSKSEKQYDDRIKNHLMFYLAMAKKGGYKWRAISMFGKLITYEQIKNPIYYMEKI